MKSMWCLLTNQFATFIAMMQGISATRHAEWDGGAECASTVEKSHANAPLVSTALVMGFSFLSLLAIGANNISGLSVFCQIFEVFVVLLRFLDFPLYVIDS